MTGYHSSVEFSFLPSFENVHVSIVTVYTWTWKPHIIIDRIKVSVKRFWPKSLVSALCNSQVKFSDTGKS